MLDNIDNKMIYIYKFDQELFLTTMLAFCFFIIC